MHANAGGGHDDHSQMKQILWLLFLKGICRDLEHMRKRLNSLFLQSVSWFRRQWQNQRPYTLREGENSWSHTCPEWKGSYDGEYLRTAVWNWKQDALGNICCIFSSLLGLTSSQVITLALPEYVFISAFLSLFFFKENCSTNLCVFYLPTIVFQFLKKKSAFFFYLQNKGSGLSSCHYNRGWVRPQGVECSAGNPQMSFRFYF